MLKNILKTVFILLILSHSVGAQTYNDSLILKYRRLSVSASTDSLKTAYSDSLRLEIKRFLNTDDSYTTPLDKVPYLGDLYSPDNAFRLITWNTALKDGSYDYFCFLQHNPSKNKNAKWIELNDQHKGIRRAEYRSLNKNNWYGALYYSIVPFKKDKQTMYVLLAWEGHNPYSNKKILETLYFNKKNDPIFGKSVFETNRLDKRRVVFEYSKEAYLMVRYDEKLKQIIFNRLEPSKPDLKGLYQFYQPILVYDAYRYKKGKWKLVADIQPQNQKNEKEFHNPKDLKRPKQ